MKRFLIWPGMIFALLAMNMCIVGITLYLAHADPSFAVEPDYYRKAVAWDETAQQHAINRQLGWTVQIDRASANGPVVHLHDAHGEPIAEAHVQLIAFHNARANDRIEKTLKEREPGCYELDVAFDRPGSWELRFTITRGDDTFTATLQHWVGFRSHQ